MFKVDVWDIAWMHPGLTLHNSQFDFQRLQWWLGLGSLRLHQSSLHTIGLLPWQRWGIRAREMVANPTKEERDCTSAPVTMARKRRGGGDVESTGGGSNGVSLCSWFCFHIGVYTLIFTDTYLSRKIVLSLWIHDYTGNKRRLGIIMKWHIWVQFMFKALSLYTLSILTETVQWLWFLFYGIPVVECMLHNDHQMQHVPEGPHILWQVGVQTKNMQFLWEKDIYHKRRRLLSLIMVKVPHPTNSCRISHVEFCALTL